MGKSREKKSRCRPLTLLLSVLLAALLAAAVHSGWKLYCYYAEYAEDSGRYEDLRRDVVSMDEASGDADTDGSTDTKGVSENVSGTDTKRKTEQAPISVDWDALLEVNEDIIGWVYFTGLPQISYPILQAEDNSYYVNRTFDLSSDASKAGSIFMDYRMNRDFSSPYSIIYGHNVRDGSMLSDLAGLKDQQLYDEDPYFWILTPDGEYQYQVFSIFQCHRSADVFQKFFDDWNAEFFAWEQELKDRNLMEGDAELAEEDHVIVFSTCVPNSYDRTIVCGRCISREQPPYGEKEAEEETTEEETGKEAI